MYSRPRWGGDGDHRSRTYRRYPSCDPVGGRHSAGPENRDDHREPKSRAVSPTYGQVNRARPHRGSAVRLDSLRLAPHRHLALVEAGVLSLGANRLGRYKRADDQRGRPAQNDRVAVVEPLNLSRSVPRPERPDQIPDRVYGLSEMNRPKWAVVTSAAKVSPRLRN